MDIEAFPLQWPVTWPRTNDESRSEARYKVGYSVSISALGAGLRLMGATDIVISSNVPVRKDGLPYADFARRRIDDPGVAVYFQREGMPQVIACDVWDRVHHNIRAIGLTVEGLRAIQRAGASELLKRAFTGFKALPPVGGTVQWRDVLGCGQVSTYAEVKALYRKLASEQHPDAGGDVDHMSKINEAWERAKAELGDSRGN